MTDVVSVTNSLPFTLLKYLVEIAANKTYLVRTNKIKTTSQRKTVMIYRHKKKSA